MVVLDLQDLLHLVFLIPPFMSHSNIIVSLAQKYIWQQFVLVLVLVLVLPIDHKRSPK